MGNFQQLKISLVVLITLIGNPATAALGYDDRDCDLNSASKCFSDPQNIFHCHLNSSISCSDQLRNESFDLICRSMNYTLNTCLKDILGYGCEGSSNYKFYQQWLKPLNAVLNKVCSENESDLRIVLSEMFKSDCGEGNQFLNCLWQSDEKLGIMDLITSEMTGETCTNLDLKLQMCLQYEDSNCKSLGKVILELGKEFLDNADCNNHPIFVPLEESNGEESEDDRDCAPRMATECFSPLLQKWSGYLENKSYSSNYTDICTYANYALNICGMQILGFACENNPDHQYYSTWLGPMTSIYSEMCVKNNGLVEELENVKSCWSEFTYCLQESEIFAGFINLITGEITAPVCLQVGDTIETCLSELGFPECDLMMKRVENLKQKFEVDSHCKDKMAQHEKSSSFKIKSFPKIIYLTILFCNMVLAF